MAGIDPQCACGEIWPGEGHPPECPVAQLIATLRAKVAELEMVIEVDDGRLRQAAELSGVGYFGCDTPEVLADTIGELREELRAKVDELELVQCRHGWRGSTPDHTSSISTPCPTCGLRSLFVAVDGHLTCANLSCKEPSPESAWNAARAAQREG